MSTKAGTERALKSFAHWALIRQRGEHALRYFPEHDEDEGLQALHCPWYVPLEGSWGGDWGCIMHPQSEKFGQLVFEHEWCGCGHHDSTLPEQVWT
jgi:hypothetical protein